MQHYKSGIIYQKHHVQASALFLCLKLDLLDEFIETLWNLG